MSDNKTAYAGKDYPVHTNGPWEADATHCRTAINSKATANSPRKHIAMVNITKNPEYEITIEEHEANARLIAAAPELYAALERLYGRLIMSDRDGESHITAEEGEMAESALKKARGEE